MLEKTTKKRFNHLIIISGTPATGKTTLAKKLAKLLSFEYLDLEPILESISEGYDQKKQCKIIDVKKLNSEIIKKIKGKKMIIASHLAHNLPKNKVDLCIITKCSDLKILKKRLLARRYPLSKIKENLECEVFDVCLTEAKKKGHNILVIDTSQNNDFDLISQGIKKLLNI